MINNLRIFFCVVLCAVVFFGGENQTAAQTNAGDKILVAGKQPLRQSQIDKIIEFYEWAFETGFSADERTRFQAISVEAFRQDAAASAKNADALIRVLGKVLAQDEDAQRKLRGSFIEDLVKDLRSSRDEASQLLIGIYERAQTGTNTGSENTGGEVSATSKSSAGVGSNRLAGKWVRSAGAGRGDDGTGKTTYSSGENTTFEFYADGTMLFTFDKKVLAITQCRISEVTKIPGTYTAEGNQLTINLGAGNSVGTSTCDRAGNFKKTLTASTVRKSFVIRKMESVFRPDEPLLLCFEGAAKDGDCFERANK